MEVVLVSFGPQGLIGKHTGCLEGSWGEKRQDGHSMKKAVIVVMKSRHRGTSGSPVSFRVKDEVTPGEQIASTEGAIMPPGEEDKLPLSTCATLAMSE